MKTCENCKHFNRTAGKSGNVGDVGTCRRYPMPATKNKTETCGEHSNNKTKLTAIVCISIIACTMLAILAMALLK